MSNPLRFLFALLVFGALRCAATTRDALPPKTPSAPAAQQLDRAQQTIADRLDAAAGVARANPEAPVVGIAVKVVYKGTTLLERGYGFTDLDGKRPMPRDAIFRIGSLTKQFTAAAILQLAEEGKLKLDDPIGKYLQAPYLKDSSQPIARVTLQQLLSHTSGIHNFTSLPWNQSHKRTPVSHAELVAVFAELPLDFEPGTRFSYSNSNYFLLGLVVEQVSGQDYAEYLRQHVFAPAGLFDTRFCPDAQDYPRATPGYERDSGQLRQVAAFAMANAFAAGGLCSNVADLVRWSEALSSGKVIAPASYTRMRSETLLKDGQHSAYGFGLSLGELAGHPCINHSGGIEGFVSLLAYYPEDELYITVLANTGSSVPETLSEQLARIVLGIPDTEPKDPARGSLQFHAVRIMAATSRSLVVHGRGPVEVAVQAAEAQPDVLGAALAELEERGATASAEDARFARAPLRRRGDFWRSPNTGERHLTDVRLP